MPRHPYRASADPSYKPVFNGGSATSNGKHAPNGSAPADNAPSTATPSTSAVGPSSPRSGSSSSNGTKPNGSSQAEQIAAAAAAAGFANFKVAQPSAAPSKANGGSVDIKGKGRARDVESNGGSSSKHASIDPLILEGRMNLPIWSGRQAIVDAVRQNDTVVLLGETGSGKTTQIPQFLYEAGFTSPRTLYSLSSSSSSSSASTTISSAPSSSKPLQIAITQPRRVAAISLARRVAQEMACPDPAGLSHAMLHQAGSAAAAANGSRNALLLGKMAKKSKKRAARLLQAQQAHAAAGGTKGDVPDDWETSSTGTSTTVASATEPGQQQQREREREQHRPPLVGYAIRFDDRTGPATRIKYMTDGFLLREMMGPGLHQLAARADGGRGNGKQPGKKEEEEAEANGRAAGALSPSLLARYSVLIIDEAHERTLDTDLVLGMAKSIQRERRKKWDEWAARHAAGDAEISSPPPAPPLKIIVMSATLDAEKFSSFFSSPTGKPAPILYVQGRQHAVTTYFTSSVHEEWQDAALRAILQIHIQHPPGDMLVFMTGQEEIEKMRAQLEAYGRELVAYHEAMTHAQQEENAEEVNGGGERRKKKARLTSTAPPHNMLVLPMYAALGSDASMAVFQPTPPRTRKIVLATNIAETSVTIPGIKYVVDPGLAKVKVYSSTTGIEILEVQPISRSSALQRAGRAGRDGPGECYFLYPQEELDKLEQSPTPDIHKVDLSNACLQLCAVGRHPLHFDWIDKPDDEEVSNTITRLVQLGAIQMPKASASDGAHADHPAPVNITPIGAKMAMLPLNPSYARILLGAADISPTAARQARDLVAILSADRGIFVEPTEPNKRDAATRARASLAHPSGDHATFLCVLYQFLSVREQAGKKHSSGSANAKEKAIREEVKAWCEAHYLHYRTLQSILSIRAQLQRICKQYNIVCDDEDAAADPEHGKHGNGAAVPRPTSPLFGSDSEAEEGESTSAGLFVRKNGERAATDAAWRTHHDERYEDLRRALLTARLSSVAMRLTGDARGGAAGAGAGSYKRGDQIVKIHPSSVLSHKLPDLIVFEEIVLTSQLFVRCVSAVEPQWFSEAIHHTRTLAHE